MMNIKNDVKEVLYSEEVISKRVKELGAEVSKDYEGKDLLVVGVLKGSISIYSRFNKSYNYSL